MDYLRIGQAGDLSGPDRKLYRYLEILPGSLSWMTLLGLIVLAYLHPVFVAYFIIAFNVYWLLLVVYLGIHLVYAYLQMKKNSRTDWAGKLSALSADQPGLAKNCLARQGLGYDDILHIVFLPAYKESREVVETCIQGLIDDGYGLDKMIVVLAQEERAGPEYIRRAHDIEKEFGPRFRNFLVTVHPDGLAGEIKGKGSNQAWAARIAKKEIIDKEDLDQGRLIASVFDVDTIVKPGYFHCLAHKFLTVDSPYRASYQPVPMYHNNVWQAPFFSPGWRPVPILSGR
jgi:cellulose synthase/poly-beta-1,6-N-acetylglucosamine synthase-like glycosyltransferase